MGLLSALHVYFILAIAILQPAVIHAILRAVNITLQNQPIVLTGFENDMVFRHIARTGEWDRDVVAFAKLLCPLGTETMFDIGANLGYMTLQFALMVPTGNVYSFEPHPSNFMLLDTNVKKNNMHNVKTFNNAVSNEQLTMCIERFHADPALVDGAIDSSKKRMTNNGDIKLPDKVHEGASCINGEVAIKTMGLEGVASELVELHFMKVDVQGYELRVLKSALPQILKFEPYIIIEFEEWNMNRMSDSYGTMEIVKFIREEMHYDLFLMPSGWPADHLLVPNSKLPKFRSQFSQYIQPLDKPNSVNKNIEAGVKEQICLTASQCNAWKMPRLRGGNKAKAPEVV